jgi:hypothetical protein
VWRVEVGPSYSGPIVGADRLFTTESKDKRFEAVTALDQRGMLYLLRANAKQFELLDKRRLNDAESWAHLAIAGNDLFVRELNAVAACRWTAPATPPTKLQAALLSPPFLR